MMPLYLMLRLWHSSHMPTATKPEPKPFERFQQFAKQVLSVPKKEIDRREAEYKAQRASAKPQELAER
jgi:hypothetical protein